MALAFSCRSSRQGFLLFQLVGVGLSPMHLPEQQGRGVLLSSQATTLETFSHRNHVIWYLECYRCQILPFFFFFFKLLACPYTIQLEPHKEVGWGVHLSQPGTIQWLGLEPFHTLHWFPVLLASDLIFHWVNFALHTSCSVLLLQ